MISTNLSPILVLLVNIFLINLLALVNSTLSSFGVFLSISGVFFYSTIILLNGFQAKLVLFITGLFLDVQMQTLFGFHAFALLFFHVITTEWYFRSKNSEFIRPGLIEIFCNSILMISWAILTVLIFEGFDTLRFFTDFCLSTLLLIPICKWNLKLISDLLDILKITDEKNLRTN
ncbi:MAG: hypothetical protein CMI27_03375 [Opitutae bacterium]|nr:hypothetical protein [Opitutae bacterium]|tara:strand:+ start:543 stop:1067 length:525 start_codon:yes stop_codon:yes gene_type:complete